MMVDLLCFGDSDGWIDVIVSGGVGVYTYLWSNGDSETIMESETIEFSSAVWLNENPGGLNGEIPLVSAIADDLSWSVSTCSYLSSTEVFNGDGTVTVSSVYGSDGGSNTCTLTYPPYIGAISISTVSTHDLSDYSIIGDISFSVIATDFTFSSIGVFSGFTIDGDMEGTLAGGIAVVNGAEDVSNLSADIYTLTVTDETGCFDVFEQEVTEPDEFIVSSDYNNISCYGENDGSIDIEVEGGGGDYDYTWTLDGVLFSTDQDLSNLSPGSYSVTVIDNSGCGEEILPFSIIEPEEIQIIIDNVESATCFSFVFDDGSIDIYSNGGYRRIYFIIGFQRVLFLNLQMKILMVCRRVLIH